MIHGSCLCGALALRITRTAGSFELCHCSRCRKATGSAFLPALRVPRGLFVLERGADQLRTCVDAKAAWHEITDTLPCLDRVAVRQLRQAGPAAAT